MEADCFLLHSSPFKQTPPEGEHSSALHEIAFKIGRARCAKPKCAAKHNIRFDAVGSPDTALQEHNNASLLPNWPV